MFPVYIFWQHNIALVFLSFSSFFPSFIFSTISVFPLLFPTCFSFSSFIISCETFWQTESDIRVIFFGFFLLKKDQRDKEKRPSKSNWSIVYQYSPPGQRGWPNLSTYLTGCNESIQTASTFIFIIDKNVTCFLSDFNRLIWLREVMLVNDLLSTINFQHFRNVPESVSEIHFIKIEINEKTKETFLQWVNRQIYRI